MIIHFKVIVGRTRLGLHQACEGPILLVIVESMIRVPADYRDGAWLR